MCDFTCRVITRCWLPGYRIHVSNDVGANICAASFVLTDLETFTY